jgi:hypothetical protein
MVEQNEKKGCNGGPGEAKTALGVHLETISKTNYRKNGHPPRKETQMVPNWDLEIARLVIFSMVFARMFEKHFDDNF